MAPYQGPPKPPTPTILPAPHPPLPPHSPHWPYSDRWPRRQWVNWHDTVWRPHWADYREPRVTTIVVRDDKDDAPPAPVTPAPTQGLQNWQIALIVLATSAAVATGLLLFRKRSD